MTHGGSMTGAFVPRQAESMDDLERRWWRYHYGVDSAAEWLASHPLADDEAAHQIRITYASNGQSLAVTCTCGHWKERLYFSEKSAEQALELFREHLACL
jgi:hypothetical protein